MTSAEEGYGYITEKDALGRRASRIEGQVRGIASMIAEERYCIDIITQIAAAKTALESLASVILDDHIRHCVTAAISAGNSAEIDTKVQELLDAVNRFSKTK